MSWVSRLHGEYFSTSFAVLSACIALAAGGRHLVPFAWRCIRQSPFLAFAPRTAAGSLHQSRRCFCRRCVALAAAACLDSTYSISLLLEVERTKQAQGKTSDPGLGGRVLDLAAEPTAGRCSGGSRPRWRPPRSGRPWCDQRRCCPR